MRTLQALPLLLATSLAAQRTWIVDAAGGPGVFLDIPPAIAAASPGDRIEVRGTGPYSEFTAARGVDIEALASAGVPRFTVQGVPVGESARIAGFAVGTPVLQFFDSLIQVANCQGAVLLSRIQTQRPFVPPYDRIIWVSGCSSVSIVDCYLSPSWTTMRDHLPVTLEIDRSAVMVQRSRIDGCPGYYGEGPGPGARADIGGDCVLLRSAVHFVANQSTFSAGKGGRAAQSRPLPAAAGGDGIVALGSGGLVMAGSRVHGGAGGDPTPYMPQPGPPGSAVTGSGVRITKDCMVTGTSSGVTIPNLPIMLAPGEVFQGTPITAHILGTPNAFVLVLIDSDHGHLPVPGFTVPYLLTMGSFVGPGFVLDSNGGARWTFTLPPDPAWQNRFLFLQGIAVTNTLQVELTGRTDLRMR
jgi:hypothetical protein